MENTQIAQVCLTPCSLNGVANLPAGNIANTYYAGPAGWRYFIDIRNFTSVSTPWTCAGMPYGPPGDIASSDLYHRSKVWEHVSVVVPSTDVQGTRYISPGTISMAVKTSLARVAEVGAGIATATPLEDTNVNIPVAWMLLVKPAHVNYQTFPIISQDNFGMPPTLNATTSESTTGPSQYVLASGVVDEGNPTKVSTRGIKLQSGDSIVFVATPDFRLYPAMG